MALLHSCTNPCHLLAVPFVAHGIKCELSEAVTRLVTLSPNNQIHVNSCITSHLTNKHL